MSSRNCTEEEINELADSVGFRYDFGELLDENGELLLSEATPRGEVEVWLQGYLYGRKDPEWSAQNTVAAKND